MYHTNKYTIISIFEHFKHTVKIYNHPLAHNTYIHINNHSLAYIHKSFLRF